MSTTTSSGTPPRPKTDALRGAIVTWLKEASGATPETFIAAGLIPIDRMRVCARETEKIAISSALSGDVKSVSECISLASALDRVAHYFTHFVEFTPSSPV